MIWQIVDPLHITVEVRQHSIPSVFHQGLCFYEYDTVGFIVLPQGAYEQDIELHTVLFLFLSEQKFTKEAPKGDVDQLIEPLLQHCSSEKMNTWLGKNHSGFDGIRIALHPFLDCFCKMEKPAVTFPTFYQFIHSLTLPCSI